MPTEIKLTSEAGTNAPYKLGSPPDFGTLYSGRALEFDGLTDYVDTGYTGLTVHTNATTSFWCKMGDFSGSQTMGCHHSKRFYVGFNGENAFIGVADSFKAATDISSYIAIDTWMHICLVAEDGTATYYIDGVARDTMAYEQSSEHNPDSNFFIGARSPAANYYTGNICQVGIWDAALDQEQIQSIMEKTYEEFTASEKEDLVSYWALDEAATNDGSVAIVEDKNDTTFGSNITPTWSDVGLAGTASVSGQVITFPQSGVSQVNASDASAGIIKINATVTNYTGSGNVNLPWDGAGGSNMLISANGTFEYYANAADASWSIYTPDGAGCTVTINSMKKPNGNYGALV